MLEERRLAVLRAIVEDYVSTHEPVGSKALVERHNLGVSPATIRNDMAALEDEGFIAQPHTSAGRVPTDLGYRLFVDRLSGVKPLSPPERRAIHQFLDEAVDLDDVMSRTVRLLAQITRQVALVQYPSLQRSSIRHVELVSLSSTRLILVIIVDTGRVEQRVIECPMPVSEEAIADLRSRLIVALAGKPFSSVADAVTDFEESFAEADRPLVRVVLSGVLESVAERHDERVVLGGTAHLARYGEAFPLAIQPVLEALEEQVVLLRLLGEAANPQGITVRIGHENPVEGLEATSVITAQYARGDQAVASLGVVGPTHMDYPGTMAAVHAVARYVSRILDEQ
jgi:heat-inducible transcriptional repressor